jgi:adenosine deaminase
VTKPQQTEGYTFYIITGSFKDEINAKKLAKEFMDNGYQGVEVIQSDNLYGFR